MYHEVNGERRWAIAVSNRERKSIEHVRVMAAGPHPRSLGNKIAALVIAVMGALMATDDELGLGIVLLLAGLAAFVWLSVAEWPYHQMRKQGRVISLDDGEGDTFRRYVLFGGDNVSLLEFTQDKVLATLSDTAASQVDAFLQDEQRLMLLREIARLSNPALRDKAAAALLAKSPDLAVMLESATRPYHDASKKRRQTEKEFDESRLDSLLGQINELG